MVDEQANSRERLLIAQMKRSERITEEMKAQDPMEWVRRMNSILVRVRECIMAEMICN